MPSSTPFYTYILQCADGTFYIGSTANLQERIERHNTGRGPDYTATRRPVRLVYSEPHETLSSAVERERQIKKWTRAKKEALIEGDLVKLRTLSTRRTS